MLMSGEPVPITVSSLGTARVFLATVREGMSTTVHSALAQSIAAMRFDKDDDLFVTEM